MAWPTLAAYVWVFPSVSEATGAEPLAGVAAAQFGISRDGQEARAGAGLFPILAAGHGVVQSLFALLVAVVQSTVRGG